MIDRLLNKKFVMGSIVASAAFFIFICSLYFYQFSNGWSADQSDWAGFGSYVGGTLGALFAFASFATLLYTLFLQREELKVAIDALEKSAESHQKQVENHQAQKFETTFYSLLQLHNQTLKELEVKMKENDAFLMFEDYSKLEQDFELDESERSEIFEQHLKSQAIEDRFNDPDILLKHLKKVISTEVELSQYFRILYQTLKFIAKNNILNDNKSFDNKYLNDRKNIDEESEKMYASLVRTFVPVKFLPILALHCMYTDQEFHNLEKYRILLERYDFLEHVQLGSFDRNLAVFLILDRYSHAFGENRDIDNTASEILSVYDRHYDLKDGGYIQKYSDRINQA